MQQFWRVNYSSEFSAVTISKIELPGDIILSSHSKFLGHPGAKSSCKVPCFWGIHSAGVSEGFVPLVH